MTPGSFFVDLTSFLGRIEEESMSMKQVLFSSVSGDSTSSLRNSFSVFDEQIFARGEIDGVQLTKRDACIIERALAKREDTCREMILEAAGLESGLTATEEAVNKLSSQREATLACLELLEFNQGALNDLEERSMAYGYNRRKKPVDVLPKQNSVVGTEEEEVVYSSTTTHECVVENCDGQQQQQSYSIVSNEQQCSISLHEGGGKGDGMVETALVEERHQQIVVGGQDECCDEGSAEGGGEPKTPTLSEWAVSRHTRSILKPTWGNGGECNPSVPVRSLKFLALTERIATPMPNRDASHNLEFTTPTDNNQPHSNQDNNSSDSDPPTPLVMDIGLKTTSLQQQRNRLSTETNSTNSSSTPASKIVDALSPMKTPHHRSMLENSTVLHNTSDTQNEDVNRDDKNEYLRDSLNVSDSIDPFSTPSTHRHALYGASNAANLPESRPCHPPDSTTCGTAMPSPQDHHLGDNTADVDDASTPQMSSPPKVSVMKVEDLENLASARPLKKAVDLVSEEEYASAPKFLTLQVTRDVLNTMVEKLNQYTTIHPSTDEWLLSGDEMVEIMNADSSTECGDADTDANKTHDEKYDEKCCKTALLSLIHLKRLQMRGGGVIRYEILRSEGVPT